jgi:hypothetical protein
MLGRRFIMSRTFDEACQDARLQATVRPRASADAVSQRAGRTMTEQEIPLSDVNSFVASIENADVKKQALQLLAKVQERLEPVDALVRRAVRDQPLLTLVGVLGVGYLLGRLVRRLSHS